MLRRNWSRNAKKYKPNDGQYTLDAQLKKFGDKGETTVTKELRQFNKYNVFEPLDAKSLSESEKKAHYHHSYPLKKREMEWWKHGHVQTGVSNEAM